MGTGGSFYFVVWSSTSSSTAVSIFFSSLLKVIFSLFCPYVFISSSFFDISHLCFWWVVFFLSFKIRKEKKKNYASVSFFFVFLSLFLLFW